MSPLRSALLIVVVVMNVAHAEDSLGRLFLTPEQRQELDTQRDPNAPRAADGLTSSGTTAKPTLVLSGVVRRSGGSDVVWVNGARTSTAPGQPVHLRRGPDENNRVTLENAGGTVVRLKPGQFWDPATGRVADCLGCTAVPATTGPATLPDSLAAPATGTKIDPATEPRAETPAETPPVPSAVTPPAAPPKTATPPAVASASTQP